MSAATGRSGCDGYVKNVRGHIMLFTGRTRVAGEHMKRDDLFKEVRQRGARPLAGTRNRDVTLLVVGELPRT